MGNWGSVAAPAVAPVAPHPVIGPQDVVRDAVRNAMGALQTMRVAGLDLGISTMALVPGMELRIAHLDDVRMDEILLHIAAPPDQVIMVRHVLSWMAEVLLREYTTRRFVLGVVWRATHVPVQNAIDAQRGWDADALDDPQRRRILARHALLPDGLRVRLMKSPTVRAGFTAIPDPELSTVELARFNDYVDITRSVLGVCQELVKEVIPRPGPPATRIPLKANYITLTAWPPAPGHTLNELRYTYNGRWHLVALRPPAAHKIGQWVDQYTLCREMAANN